ncbi:MAG: hypothetical protein F2760_05670 [Actinobacteria bacterium]|nr:hypothetical protein [Actinomycetota bacterium]MSX51882.1 hypothetical protein [Actinomycetota bacterium]
MLIDEILIAILIISFGIPIGLHDLAFQKISNSVLSKFLLGALSIKALELVVLENFHDFLVCGLGSLLLLILLSFCNNYAGNPVGYGDIKLMALLTFILNFEKATNFVFWLLTIWIFGALSFVAISLKKMRFQGSIAMAPAIFMATITYLAARRWIFLSQ